MLFIYKRILECIYINWNDNNDFRSTTQKLNFIKKKLSDLYSDEKFENELNNNDFNPIPNDSVNEINEVDDYLGLQPLKYDCDPLNWWKEYSCRTKL